MPRILILPVLLALMGGALALGIAAAQEEFQLTPQNDSGVSGTVTLTATDDQTDVELTLEGSEPDSVHPAHIHEGTDCADAGDIVAELQDVEIGDDGTGSSDTTADLPIAAILNGNHLVAAHQGPTLEDDPTIISCALLPADTGQETPTVDGTPEASPTVVGTPQATPPVSGTPQASPTVIPPATGSGGFLDDGGSGLPVLPFLLLGVAATLLAAGAIGWSMSRKGP